MSNFERNIEVKEALRIGKFWDCVKVEQVYHRRHKNAKFGTYALFQSEEEKEENLNRVCNLFGTKFLKEGETLLSFHTKKGIIDLVDMEGCKIMYRGKQYQLPEIPW